MAYIIEEDYYQPDFYHLSQDSLELASFIKEQDKDWEKALEIGSGCGVISGELAREFHSKKILALEKLKEFQPFLEKNLSSYPNVEIVIDDFLNLKSESSFDIIFFNPPYFFEESSRPSPNPLTNHCRRIKRELFEKWFGHTRNLLSKKGRLYFCHRDSDFVARDWGFILKEKREKTGCTLYSWALF